MKKIRLLIVLMVCVVFSGCREYGEKRIVKLITLDKENVSLYYYDYTQEKPTYLIEKKKNSGIENTIVELLSENEYDLKLCKYAICDADIISKESDSVYKALIETKFSPDICILEGDTNSDGEKYIKQKNKNYPIYSYKVSGDKITGVVEKADGNIKNLIVDSQLYKTLEGEESFVFDVLNNNVKKGTYTFEYKNNKMSAVMEGISTYYFTDNNVLNINIHANLKSYKGMAANKESKRIFADIMQESLKYNAENILKDKQIADGFDLLWYSKLEKFDKIKINVKIK